MVQLLKQLQTTTTKKRNKPHTQLNNAIKLNTHMFINIQSKMEQEQFHKINRNIKKIEKRKEETRKKNKIKKKLLHLKSITSEK